MSFEELIQDLNSDTLVSLTLFRPELTLCAAIVLILLLRVIGPTSRLDSFLVMLAGSVVALGFSLAPFLEMDRGTIARTEIFTGMLVYDGFTVYFRIVLLLFAVLFAVFTRISGIPDRDAASDAYPLVLGATLGMCLMASANHLLIVFLGVEMASVPSYVLAGLLKGRRRSSEAALKYAVFGAGTAGVMLYGISLLGGVLGSFHIPTMALRLSDLLASEPVRSLGSDRPLVLMIGGLMVMVGVAFKLSAVPFHFWCPDVFEGASAEVNAFLSVASKAAALALLVRVAVGFGTLPPVNPEKAKVAAQFSVKDIPDRVVLAAHQAIDEGSAPLGAKQLSGGHIASDTVLEVDRLGPAREFIGKLVAFLAVITCTFGNLAAYGQTNIKRLLAYSTIAHAGYMMMPVAAAMALAGKDPGGAEEALAALAFYVGVYFFMNLGAFAIIAFLRNALHSEEIADYAGLIRRAPVTVICFSLILVSLIGMPPLSGFVGKFQVFAVLMKAGLLSLLVIGGLNTALSLFYYLRVVKVLTMDPEPQQRMPISISFIPGTFIVAMTIPVLVMGVWWDGLNEWALQAASRLLS